jgi:hypothetical protein
MVQGLMHDKTIVRGQMPEIVALETSVAPWCAVAFAASVVRPAYDLAKLLVFQALPLCVSL